MAELEAKLRERRFQSEKKHLSVAEVAAHKLANNPLMRENKHIRASLLAHAHGGGGGGVAAGAIATRAAGLDKLLVVKRVEAQGAIVLQRFWRRILRGRFWKRFNIEQRCSYTISVRT